MVGPSNTLKGVHGCPMKYGPARNSLMKARGNSAALMNARETIQPCSFVMSRSLRLNLSGKFHIFKNTDTTMT
jgi:hypothetical protein